MKLLLIFLATILNSLLLHSAKTINRSENREWKLVWEENFKGSEHDTSKWTLINTLPSKYENAPDWQKHMKSDDRVYAIENGKLYLKGIENPGILNDPRPFLTGGVNSRGKFSFLYGKIEIRAKKECARGAWPAIWMMPEESVYGGWPHSGEIDIMEHLNYDTTIHHTVHTRYTNVLNNRTDPPRGIGNIRADVTQWNVYGLEWHPDVLIWTLNGKETFRYPKVEGLDPDLIQWPFDQPFYIILSQQLGGSWIGEVKADELPVSMIIDYVRVYQQ